MRPALLAAAGASAMAAVAPLALGGLLFFVARGGEDSSNRIQFTSSCSVIAASTGQTPGQLSPEQLRHATTIIDVGRRRGVSPYGWTIAVATALQESTLRNLLLWAGDRDSVGLFQQRPSQGWGTPKQLNDPVYASGRFYEALVRVSGWESMPLTRAAQAVQRSAFPLAYAKHEPLAAALVRAIGQVDPGACRASAGTWVLPVTGYRLTSPFGPRIHAIRGTVDFHTGLDFAAASGTPVVSASDGVVIGAGPGGGYGNLVKVRHTNDVETWYAHLDTMAVAVGQQMSVGERIGAVGSTGNSTGPHLHLEVRVNGSPVDPAPWLAERGQDPAG